ncbi:hypothetical protein ABIE89_000026 [Bradyrhizobium niftali]
MHRKDRIEARGRRSRHGAKRIDLDLMAILIMANRSSGNDSPDNTMNVVVRPALEQSPRSRGVVRYSPTDTGILCGTEEDVRGQDRSVVDDSVGQLQQRHVRY